MKELRMNWLGCIALVVAAGCATGGGGAGGPDTGTIPSPTNQGAGQQSAIWPVKTREHVDLWLHGYALLQEDTTFVPFFRRGYTTEITVLKNRANVVSQLDANRDKLRARLAVNPGLINAQFVPLSFSTWNELTQTVDLFIRANGDPRAASSMEQANAIAMLAAYFQTGADRDWLRLFVQSLNDESTKFYHSYWTQQQRERSNVLDVVDGQWRNTYLPKFQRFLSNTQQASGEILLSLPLDGEGRSQNNGKTANIVTVTFPDRPNDAMNAIYVIAHEIVGSLASVAVTDNITPEQRRPGLGERYQSAAAVRGGALLLQRVAPETLDGYMRYYLQSVNRPATSNVQSAFISTFGLPDTIRDALNRQLDVVLGGI